MSWNRIIPIALIVLLCATAFAGCTGTFVNTNKAKLDSVVFTRTGANIQLSEPVNIKAVEIKSNGTSVFSSTEAVTADMAVEDFIWKPNQSYSFKLSTDGGDITGTVFSPDKPAAVKLLDVKLTDVTPGAINATTQNIKGDLTFSPDGKYVVVATGDNYLLVYDVNASARVFEKKLSEGQACGIDFSGDGKILYVGEQSAEGYVYAFDLSTGKELWKYGTARDLGTSSNGIPGARRVEVNGDILYVAASRGDAKSSATRYTYWSRIYALNASDGSVRWKFPENENIDTYTSWLDVSNDGKYVAFEVYESVKTVPNKSLKYPDGMVYMLDSNGKKLWEYRKPVLQYQNNTFSYRGICFSPDGKWLTSTDTFGAGYLFNNEEILRSGNAVPSKVFNISTAYEVNGIPVYASLNYAYILNDNTVIFSVGSTYVPSQLKSKYAKALYDHPNAQTLVAYDTDGDLLWKYKVEGYSGKMGISDDGRFLAIPVAQNLVTGDLGVHGVYVFDNAVQGGATQKLNYVYHTEGLTTAGDVSPDGKYIAVVEVPSRLDDGRVIGSHTLHVLM